VLRPRRLLALAALACALTATAAGASLPPLPGEIDGPPPWPRNIFELRARLDQIGVPALLVSGQTLHIHQHLDVFYDGKRVTVPGGIGINELERFISPIHTHDASGIIHVESPDVRAFVLGDVFAVWGVRFSPTCLGGGCRTKTKRVWVFVNGKQVPSNHDPRTVVLKEHQEIVVAYGTRAQLPKRIPRSYPFPSPL
jgi:hypothetical protein